MMLRWDSVRKCLAVILSATCMAPFGFAQQGLESIAPEKPTGNVLVRPYEAADIPPVRLANSTRLSDLLRGGKIYLTAQDAIALALENDINIELDRYNPLVDTWNLERDEAGGALPGVPSGASQASTVTSGLGVTGSQAGAGVGNRGGSSNSGNIVGATISQIGPTTPTLDPVFQSAESFGHFSAPQAQLLQSQVSNLIQNKRNFTASISEGLLSGGNVSLSFSNAYLNENSPSDVLNPASAPSLSFSFRHNLLLGFGTAVNGRFITVAKKTLQIDDIAFATQVISEVANVLNLYYGLVADYQDVKAKQTALDVAQRFYDDNKKQVQIGTMAPLDVTTAESQVASSQFALVTSQTTLEQQQVSLKNLLSRNGLADPLIAGAEIIPLDRIEVPEKDNLPPLKQLIATALASRLDLRSDKLNLENAKTSALGTQNGVLPQLVALATTSNSGLAGTPRIVPVQGQFATTTVNSPLPPGLIICPGAPGTLCEVPGAAVVGGVGTALGQIIRRDYPSENAGGYIVANVHNRQAQGDEAIDQLGLRQTELQNLRTVNQVAVDVSNQAIGMQQARVRYQTAIKNRVLDQQLLEAEQKKFSLGASTTFLVVQAQSAMATAQSAEVAALVAYSNARVSLDQILGTTLKTNNVSIDEAKSGRVTRTSALPATLPQ